MNLRAVYNNEKYRLITDSTQTRDRMDTQVWSSELLRNHGCVFMCVCSYIVSFVCMFKCLYSSILLNSVSTIRYFIQRKLLCFGMFKIQNVDLQLRSTQ